MSEGWGGMWAVPRHYIKLDSGIGHRQTVASIGLLVPVARGLHLGRREQSSARVSIRRDTEIRGSPHQLTLSRSSLSGL
jgi:hypothetical protein